MIDQLFVNLQFLTKKKPALSGPKFNKLVSQLDDL